MDQKEQDNKQLWDSFLNFLCLELFGVEVFDYYRAGKGTLEPVGEKETVLDINLDEHIVKLYLIADAAAAFVLDKKFHLTTGRLAFLLEAVRAVRTLFWALARNNEEGTRNEILEIRKGGRKGILLIRGTPPANPFVEILKTIGR